MNAFIITAAAAIFYLVAGFGHAVFADAKTPSTRLVWLLLWPLLWLIGMVLVIRLGLFLAMDFAQAKYWRRGSGEGGEP